MQSGFGPGTDAGTVSLSGATLMPLACN